MRGRCTTYSGLVSWETRTMRKRFLVVLLALTVLIIQPLITYVQGLQFKPLPPYPPSVADQAAVESRNWFIVFLNGLTTDCDGSPYRNMGFRSIRRHLVKTGQYCYYDTRFLMYSYTGGQFRNGCWFPQAYTSDDTFQPIAASVAHLRELVQEAAREHPDAGFVLVGHSLGGRIAFDYLDTAGDQELERIRGLVTLDAPLLGIGHQALTIPVLILELAPAKKQTVVEQLLVSHDQLFAREREVVRTIESLALKNIQVITLASRDDLVVSSRWSVATRPDGRMASDGAVVSAGRSHGTWLRRTGHVQILNHPTAREALASVLENGHGPHRGPVGLDNL